MTVIVLFFHDRRDIQLQLFLRSWYDPGYYHGNHDVFDQSFLEKVSFQDRQARIVPQRPFLEGTQNLTILFWYDS